VIRGSSAGTVLTLYLLYTQFPAPLREIHRMRDELTRRPFMFAKPSRYSTIRSIHTSFGRRLARMRRTSRLNCETLEFSKFSRDNSLDYADPLGVAKQVL
jgi:hypothetical protein